MASTAKPASPGGGPSTKENYDAWWDEIRLRMDFITKEVVSLKELTMDENQNQGAPRSPTPVPLGMTPVHLDTTPVPLDTSPGDGGPQYRCPTPINVPTVTARLQGPPYRAPRVSEDKPTCGAPQVSDEIQNLCEHLRAGTPIDPQLADDIDSLSDAYMSDAYMSDAYMSDSSLSDFATKNEDKTIKPEQKPVQKKPLSPKSVGKQPVSPKPVTKQLVLPIPVGKQSVSPKPVSKQPVSPKPVTKQLVLPIPVGKQPVSPKPVGKQPVSPKLHDVQGNTSVKSKVRKRAQSAPVQRGRVRDTGKLEKPTETYVRPQMLTPAYKVVTKRAETACIPMSVKSYHVPAHTMVVSHHAGSPDHRGRTGYKHR